MVSFHCPFTRTNGSPNSSIGGKRLLGCKVAVLDESVYQQDVHVGIGPSDMNFSYPQYDIAGHLLLVSVYSSLYFTSWIYPLLILSLGPLTRYRIMLSFVSSFCLLHCLFCFLLRC